MNDTMIKYSPNEILQILIDFYNYQCEFDPEVDNGETLTFETTISDWRMTCDLLESKKLAKCYHDFFKLNTPISDLENLLYNEMENNLFDFCNYIANNAEKAEIKPINLFGQSCMTASIFKILMTNLKRRGIEIENIKPSSGFVPLFDKNGDAFLEEVNKLAPGTLTKFEYRDNKIVRTGWTIIGISILSLILISLIWNFYWILLFPFGLGLLTILIGKRFEPETNIIGGYETIRDLIKGMELRVEKTAT